MNVAWPSLTKLRFPGGIGSQEPDPGIQGRDAQSWERSSRPQIETLGNFLDVSGALPKSDACFFRPKALA